MAQGSPEIGRVAGRHYLLSTWCARRVYMYILARVMNVTWPLRRKHLSCWMEAHPPELCSSKEPACGGMDAASLMGRRASRFPTG
jgi:hypothetical protein